MKIYNNPAVSEWQSLIKRPTSNADDLVQLVKQVFEEIKNDGDKALRVYTKRFDNVDIGAICLTKKQISDQAKRTSPEIKAAIDSAYKNIYTFHKNQVAELKPIVVTTQPGIECWQETRSVERVGLYIPGGSAPLVSTVLMLGVPAQIAGCTTRILASPPSRDGTISPAICYAALKVGITDIFRVGGIQAIAAMAIGTESIPAVDKLFGPGNQYVMAAKLYAQQFGVAMDMPAGPSEVMVVADASANAKYVAADLLSQAEHGPDSQVVLLSTDVVFVKKVEQELQSQLMTLSRKDIAESALKNSFSIVFKDTKTAIDFANRYAPEHIILSVSRATSVARQVVNAGSVFLGNYSPESAGDYASGTNHTLPTNGWAKSYGGLSVDSFVKKITFQKLTKNGLDGIAQTIKTLAVAEGLDAHANAVSVRFNTTGGQNDVSRARTNNTARL